MTTYVREKKTSRALVALTAVCLSSAALWADDVLETGDTYISSSTPTVNSGALANLNVGGGSSSLIRFDLSQLPSGTTATNVEQAILYLWVNRVGTAGSLDIAQVTSPWVENTVTFNTAPTVGAVQGTAPVAVASQWVTLDVTPLVKFWVTNPASNDGVTVTASLSAPTTVVFLDSKENTSTSHPPRLNVVLGSVGPPGPPGPPGPGSVTLVNTGAGLTGGPITTTGTIGVATGGVTNAMLANSFLTVNTSSPLAGGGTVALGGALSLSAPNITTDPTNTALGQHALSPLNTGTDNTAVGHSALGSNSTASGNTAVGGNALAGNTTGAENTAVGWEALGLNGTASNNTAVGTFSLANHTSGDNNTAVGRSALVSDTSGSENVAVGEAALLSNTTGTFNVAIGGGALESNVTGSHNTALGVGVLPGSTADENTAVGTQALLLNTTGGRNTALGYLALSGNITGTENIALGWGAGGSDLLSNNIDIGNFGTSTDSGVIRIGATGSQTQTFIAGIRGVTTGQSDAVPVMIDSTGQLGTTNSSRRFKEDIQDMGDASSGLMRLHPVTYRYKQPYNDGSKPIQFGLIAEEVDEVYPEIVAHSADGSIETVQYDKVNAMLLNEVQRQEREIQALKASVAALQAMIEGSAAARGAR